MAAYSVKIKLFSDLQVAFPGNESNHLTAQMLFSGIGLIQLLTQTSSENIDLNQRISSGNPLIRINS